MTFLVQGCLPESNIETNRSYFCRVGRALDLWPACQNLGVPAPNECRVNGAYVQELDFQYLFTRFRGPGLGCS